jgi:HEPN domain-containing protein
LPRKTDSNNPADWLWSAASDLEGVRELAARELSYELCRSKLAEILEEIVKAELIHLGWRLEKTHDLNRLALALRNHSSPLETVATPLCQAFAEVYFAARYPGFDLDDPDWPALRTQVEQVLALHAAAQARVGGPERQCIALLSSMALLRQQVSANAELESQRSV